jgi:NADPH:quinone reductase-like Zn-dependent oxidoreductase
MVVLNWQEMLVTIIGSNRTSVKKEELKQLGIHHLIVTKEENFEKRLMEITKDEGISFVYDPLAGDLCDEYLEALSLGSVIIIYGLLDPNPTLFPLVPLIRKKAIMDA